MDEIHLVEVILLIHPDEALNKSIILETAFTFSFLDGGVCFLSCCLVLNMNMQQILSQFSVQTSVYENGKAMWSNHWLVGGKFG